MRLLVSLAVLLITASPLAAQEPPVAPPEAPSLMAPTQVAPAQPEVAPEISAGAAELAPSQATAQIAPPHRSSDLLMIALQAHWVVKSVMVLLAGMAFLVLTVLLYKLVEIALALRHVRQSFRVISGETPSAPLPAAPEAGSAMLRLVEAELAALPEAIGTIEAEGLRERCRIGLARIEATTLHGLRTGVGLLAQIAATAPFIGLFGTVFGIMNAFVAIAETKTTNLSVVAPGIAEALMATAVGLGAAIPAVLVFNFLTRRIAVFRNRLGDVAALCEHHLSREIARRRLAGATMGRS